MAFRTEDVMPFVIQKNWNSTEIHIHFLLSH
jgi:hypothetical protein